MKNRIFLLIAFVIFLVGCEEKYSLHFLKNDNHIISNDDYLYGIEFSCNNKIEEFKVSDITTSINKEVEYSLVDEEIDYKNNHFYGIIFNLKNDSDFVFESFKIIINDEYEKVIELNMNVYYIEKTFDKNILPLSTPIISDSFKATSWCFLVKENIIIKKIEVLPFSNSEVYLNSLLFNSDVSVSELEEIYININKETLEVSRVCIAINYIFDGIEYEYRSDFSTIGNSIELLKGEIDK